MRTRVWFTARTVVVLGMVAGGMLLAGVSAGGAVQPISVVESAADTRAAFLDANRNGRIDAADRVAGRATIRDRTTGDPVGRDFFECVAASRIFVQERKGTWICTHVLKLAGGHIILQGEDPAGVGPNALAVTGGTGLYRNARGQADQVDFRRRTEFTINLEP